MTKYLATFFVFLQLASGQAALDAAISRQDRLKVFDKIWEALNKRFFDPKFSGVDWTQSRLKYRPLAEAAADKVELLTVLNKMTAELRVSHTRVDLNPSLGTGISLTAIEGRQIVRDVIPGSPAAKAGVQPLWVLADWKGGCTRYDELNTIRFQDSLQQGHDVEIPCTIYTPGPLRLERTYGLLQSGALYLRFTAFVKRADKWFISEVRKNLSAPAIVVDLRGNSGGALRELRKCLQVFFTKKTAIGTTQGRKGKDVPFTIDGTKDAYRGRVIVLIDQHSGSAAEVFAAAMQDTGRGTLIGRKTAGGVLFATSVKLPQGFILNLALFDYHTFKGARLEGPGVTPDEIVTLTLRDHLTNRDPDMARVRALLAAGAATSEN